ncbi:hypothetical protein, partial [Pseudoalteromonas sp. S1649]|uniref:hypothetical protein n=1 Tax=Pseudoalteromonas sp. S1649 TaxID=579508 RepID=UPI0014867FA7
PLNLSNLDYMARDQPAELKEPIESVELEQDAIGLEVSFSAMAFNSQERIIYEYQLGDGQTTYSRN